MANRRNGALHIWVTNNLAQRAFRQLAKVRVRAPTQCAPLTPRRNRRPFAPCRRDSLHPIPCRLRPCRQLARRCSRCSGSGCEVWPIHTVQFSSHAGYPGWRGRAFDAEMIDDCVAGLRRDRRAEERATALLTGYLGKPEIGEAALRALAAAARGHRRTRSTPAIP